MINFKWKAKFENLDQIKSDWRTKGGSIILYKDVWSLFAFTKIEPKLVLVAANESRSRVGFRESRRLLWAGWWALTGSAHTAAALAHNLINPANR